MPRGRRSPPMPDLSRSKGVLSCLYSRCDSASQPQSQGTHKLLFDLVLGYYEKAVNRLPIKKMPSDVDLLRLVEGAGFCFGLLDPVSNIIFNAVSFLPHDIGAAPNPSSPRRKKSKSTLSKITRKPMWDEIASKSYRGLIDFMLSYFGCLNKDQAARYLLWTGADVSLAVMLVDYEFGTNNPLPPDPDSERTQAALKMAALRARHTAPDSLVRFVTSKYPKAILSNLKVLADSNRKLTLADVECMVNLVHSLDTPCHDAKVGLLPNGKTVVYVQKITFLREALAAEAVTSKISDLGDGYSSSSSTTTLDSTGSHISSLRRIGLEGLSHCLLKADAEKHRLNACGNSCEYLQSLKMRLHEHIQNFYLTVFSLLPAGCEHMIRSILVAGHCYGPMDPVSNIIVSSIWYDRWCPLPESDRKGIQAYDILNTSCMLRTQARSLKGLLCLASALDPTSTEECAMKALRDNACDLSGKMPEMLPLGSCSSNLFHMAATAAGHPLPAGLGLLYEQLAQVPVKFAELSSVITSSRVLSPDVCNQIAALLEGVFKVTPPVQNYLQAQAQAPKLCEEALETLSRKRSGHGSKSKFIRLKLAQLLDKYASEHPWEPKYVLNFICGVEERGPLFTACYRVNFMATPESQGANTLFFAEFWVSRPKLPKPNFCCPLQRPYSGRCYFGEASARKIIYPCSTEYFMSDITAHGTKDAEYMLDTDFIYFDSQRDQKFTNDVNGYYAPDFRVLSRPIVLATDEELRRLGP